MKSAFLFLSCPGDNGFHLTSVRYYNGTPTVILRKRKMRERNRRTFDEHARDYDEVLSDFLKFQGEKHEFFSRYKIDIVRREIRRKPLRVLEYGCGTGRNISLFREIFPEARITGYDISGRSIDVASKKNPDARFCVAGRDDLGSGYDLAFVSMVFHHMEDDVREEAVRTLFNSVKPGGELFVFEHNPLNPAARYVFRNCILDRDARPVYARALEKILEKGGFETVRRRYTLFFPHSLRWLRFLERSLLGYLPLGGQYYIHSVRREEKK